MTGLPKYRYRSLDSSVKEIRLVSLQPRVKSSQLQCSPMIVSLTEPGSYDALSYVWGSTSERLPLIVGGCELQITKNLYTALQYLQYEDKPRTLWVDAICINQEDYEERSSQVQQMRSIYDKAKQVVMWLGSEIEGGHLLLELIQELRLQDMVQLSVLGSLRNPRKQEMWMAFRKFCGCKYWFRLWIIQEVASGSRKVIQFGHITLPWEDIGKLASVIVNDLRHAWSEIGFINTSLGNVSFKARLVDIESLYDLHCMSKQGQSAHLADLLRSTRRYLCSDARDKVYGVLGLAGDCQKGELEVNYRLSVAETFVNAVCFAIASSRKLNIICEVQYLPSELDLPSWVPDWTMKQRMNGLWSRLGPDYSAAGYTEPDVTYSSNRRAITVTGCQLGTIEVLGDAYIEDRTRPPFTPHMRETMMHWLKLAVGSDLNISSNNNDTTWETERTEAFWRTLIGNRIKGQSQPGIDLFRRMFDVARGVKPVPILNPEVDYIQAFHHFVSPLAFEMNAIMYNRRFFTCGQALMGVCLSKARVGDILVVLLGCDHPVIFRQEGVAWAFQGKAYVHGFMDGEAVTKWESGELKLNKFTIH